LRKVNHAALAKNFVRCYTAQVSPFVHGTFGIGKSETAAVVAKFLAKKEGRNFIHWNESDRELKQEVMNDPSKWFVYADARLTQMDPTDLRGLPGLFDKSEVVDWKRSMLFNTMGKPTARGFLFFDEMNLAVPSMQAAAYQLVNDHQVGEYPICKDVFIAAAGNRAEDMAATFAMAAPLRNRFVHYELMPPSVEEWSRNYAIPKEIDNRIIGFLHFKPAALMADKDSMKHMAMPSPRTWVKASRLIKSLKGDKESHYPEIEDQVAAAVGDGIAVEFVAWIRIRDELDIKGILEHPERAADITRVDIKWALTTGINEIYRTSTAKEFNIDNAFRVVKYFGAEFGILLLRMLKYSKGQQSFITKAIQSPAYNDFIKNHAHILNESEITS